MKPPVPRAPQRESGAPVPRQEKENTAQNASQTKKSIPKEKGKIAPRTQKNFVKANKTDKIATKAKPATDDGAVDKRKNYGKVPKYLQRINQERQAEQDQIKQAVDCLLYTSPSPRDQRGSRMPSSA